MDLFIRFVCDEHLSLDPRGPLVTRHQDGWAYCAGHAVDGHRWTAVPPQLREELERSRADAPAIGGAVAAPDPTVS